jgi:hypothetical protein
VLLPKILSEAQQAGGFAVSLKGHQMSDKYVKNMQEHQKFMNEAYTLIQNKLHKKHKALGLSYDLQLLDQARSAVVALRFQRLSPSLETHFTSAPLKWKGVDGWV